MSMSILPQIRLVVPRVFSAIKNSRSVPSRPRVSVPSNEVKRQASLPLSPSRGVKTQANTNPIQSTVLAVLGDNGYDTDLIQATMERNLPYSVILRGSTIENLSTDTPKFFRRSQESWVDDNGQYRTDGSIFYGGVVLTPPAYHALQSVLGSFGWPEDDQCNDKNMTVQEGRLVTGIGIAGINLVDRELGLQLANEGPPNMIVYPFNTTNSSVLWSLLMDNNGVEDARFWNYGLSFDRFQDCKVTLLNENDCIPEGSDPRGHYYLYEKDFERTLESIDRFIMLIAQQDIPSIEKRFMAFSDLLKASSQEEFDSIRVSPALADQEIFKWLGDRPLVMKYLFKEKHITLNKYLAILSFHYAQMDMRLSESALRADQVEAHKRIYLKTIDNHAAAFSGISITFIPSPLKEFLIERNQKDPIKHINFDA